jgi:hypothetical protein
MATVDLEPRVERDFQAAAESWLTWDPSAGAVGLGQGWDAEPLVLDWYGAGEPDLLVTSEGGVEGRFARVYRPLASPESFPTHYDAGQPVEALRGLRCLCPIPNGAESRFDLVALGREGLVLLRNEGEARRPAFSRRQPLEIPADLGVGPCRVVQIVAVDWDGDGLVDLLAGLDDLEGYWPEGDRLPAEQQVGFNQNGGHPGYDQRGVWRGRAPRGRLFWLRNVGRVGDPVFQVQPEVSDESGPLNLALHPAPLAVSWGGRGSLELLVSDARGQVRIYRNFGGQRPPVLMESRTLQTQHGPLLLPDDRTVLVADDIDGDRQLELVFGTADGRLFAVHTGATRHEVETPRPLLQEGGVPWLGGNAVLTAGDLDNDGGLDLVVGTGSGRLLMVRHIGGAGDPRYAPPIEIEAGGGPFRLDPGADGMRDGPVSPRLGYACPALVDWTGNGRLDLIVGGAGGEAHFLRNDGAAHDPRFSSPVLLRCQGNPLITPPRVRPAAADWTGRGRLDLITLDLQGSLCLYPRIGMVDLGPAVPLVDALGRFLRLDGGFGRSGRCALWAGPWTGSGRIDLLVGLPRGNRHVVPSLTGLACESLDDLPTVLLLENLDNRVLVPRPLRFADGRPVVIGVAGCSPCGVDVTRQGALDLLVGNTNGEVAFIRREHLRW